MIVYILVVLGLSAFEVTKLKKGGMKKEMIVYIALSIASIVFAVYYYNCDSSKSLSKLILDLLKIKH